MQFLIRGTTKKNRTWDIKVTQSELGADICNNILFIHAVLGCDTTSRLYGLGKGLSRKRFTSSALFRDKAEQFCKKDARSSSRRHRRRRSGTSVSVSYPSSEFAPDLCSSEIPQYASVGTAVVGCLQYEEDRLGVDDKGREHSPRYDVTSSSTRRAAPCHQMQLHN